MRKALFLSLAILLGLSAQSGSAHENEVDTQLQGGLLCVTSKSSPNHAIGRILNAGNPNSFRQQTIRVCGDAAPQDAERISCKAQQFCGRHLPVLSPVLSRNGQHRFHGTALIPPRL